jgi:phosphoglucosamine mutase
MGERGITLFETGVGDRYVLEALEAGGWALGGEQSGHLIFRDLATTGDGLLTGVQALDAARRLGRPLGDLAAELVRQVPQVLESVSVVRSGALIVDEIAGDVLAASTGLGVEGRVLVRASGTEPVVRVMVEALDPAVARRVAEGLCEAVRSRDAGGAAGS